MDRVEKVEENGIIPDNLSLLLRSSRPEPKDYVANLDQDKHTRIYEKFNLNIRRHQIRSTHLEKQV